MLFRKKYLFIKIFAVRVSYIQTSKYHVLKIYPVEVDKADISFRTLFIYRFLNCHLLVISLLKVDNTDIQNLKYRFLLYLKFEKH